MTGDEDDMRQRLRSTLPTRWFGDIAPVLDGVLSGLAVAWAGLYDFVQYITLQTRVSTATDDFLGLAAQDFLSDPFPRRPGESDIDYRQRLLVAIRRLRATCPALVAAAASAGYSVRLFEPAQPADTGAYNIPIGMAWNFAGGWGSMQMPFETLIVAYPGSNPFEAELWQSMAGTTPAGGVLWMRIAAAS